MKAIGLRLIISSTLARGRWKMRPCPQWNCGRNKPDVSPKAYGKLSWSEEQVSMADKIDARWPWQDHDYHHSCIAGTVFWVAVQRFLLMSLKIWCHSFFCNFCLLSCHRGQVHKWGSWPLGWEEKQSDSTKLKQLTKTSRKVKLFGVVWDYTTNATVFLGDRWNQNENERLGREKDSNLRVNYKKGRRGIYLNSFSILQDQPHVYLESKLSVDFALVVCSSLPGTTYVSRARRCSESLSPLWMLRRVLRFEAIPRCIIKIISLHDSGCL